MKLNDVLSTSSFWSPSAPESAAVDELHVRFLTKVVVSLVHFVWSKKKSPGDLHKMTSM